MTRCVHPTLSHQTRRSFTELKIRINQHHDIPSRDIAINPKLSLQYHKTYKYILTYAYNIITAYWLTQNDIKRPMKLSTINQFCNSLKISKWKLCSEAPTQTSKITRLHHLLGVYLIVVTDIKKKSDMFQHLQNINATRTCSNKST